jgi:hypothetical protein
MKLGLAARGGGRVRVANGLARRAQITVAVVRRKPCGQRGKLDGRVGAPELPVIWAMCRAP